MKKSSFSAREYLAQEPPEEDIREKDHALYIPIGPLENALDFFWWGTRSFQWHIYKDGYAKLCVAASLELVLNFKDEDGDRVVLSFVGASNFAIASMPMKEFLAAAKSMCIKNAASDAGRRLGRGLNDDMAHIPMDIGTSEASKAKVKPDAKILQNYAEAIKKGDQATIDVLTAIYDIKTPDNGNKVV